MKRFDKIICIIIVIIAVCTCSVGSFAVDDETTTLEEEILTSEVQTDAETTQPAPQGPAKSKNANLGSLSITGKTADGTDVPITLTPEFKAATQTYNITVPFEVVKLAITASAADSKAKLVIPEGYLSLDVGKNKSYVNVTSESGTLKRYTINTVRNEEVATSAVPSETTVVETTVEQPLTTVPVTDIFAPAEKETETSGMNIYTKLGIVLGSGALVLLGLSAYMFIKKNRFNQG